MSFQDLRLTARIISRAISYYFFFKANYWYNSLDTRQSKQTNQQKRATWSLYEGWRNYERVFRSQFCLELGSRYNSFIYVNIIKPTLVLYGIEDILDIWLVISGRWISILAKARRILEITQLRVKHLVDSLFLLEQNCFVLPCSTLIIFTNYWEPPKQDATNAANSPSTVILQDFVYMLGKQNVSKIFAN